MDISIAKLLTTVYELEGLLLVVNKHGDDTPPEVIEALKGKAQAAHELAQQVQWRTADDSAPCGQPSTATPEESPVGEAEAAQPQECAAEDTAPEATSYTPPCITATDDEEPTDVSDNASADEPSATETGEECDKADNSPEEESKADDSINEEAQEEEDIQNEEAQEEEPDECEEAVDDEADEEGLRVDEKLQRTISKDLRRAFSINDRFRFRRELFANSDIEMRDAIDMVECMHSAEEAEDYFYNDLNWEKTSPEVKDFMEIIKNHFA